MIMLVALIQATAASALSPDQANDPVESSAIGIEANAGLVSQYRFRGISLSDEEPALQADLKVTHQSGLYGGTWASSLDGFGELGGSNLELDVYGGYKLEVGRGVTLDAGLVYYAYPGSRGGDFEFFEPFANVSGKIGPVTAKVGLAFAPAQGALNQHSNVYLFNELSSSVPATPIRLKAHVGYSKGDTPLSPSGEYIDWSLGADISWRALTLGVAYVDTNLDAVDATSGGATKDIVDNAVVASLTAAF